MDYQKYGFTRVHNFFDENANEVWYESLKDFDAELIPEGTRLRVYKDGTMIGVVSNFKDARFLIDRTK